MITATNYILGLDNSFNSARSNKSLSGSKDKLSRSIVDVDEKSKEDNICGMFNSFSYFFVYFFFVQIVMFCCDQGKLFLVVKMFSETCSTEKDSNEKDSNAGFTPRLTRTKTFSSFLANMLANTLFASVQTRNIGVR